MMSEQNVPPPRAARNALLGAALDYVSRGWPVLPLWWLGEDGQCACGTSCGKNAGKHPIGSLVPHGVQNATHRPAVVRLWWRAAPNANIGIATGAASGLAVLDVDPARGGDASLAALEAEHGALPTTPSVQTGGGGRHFYFTCPPAGLRSRKDFRPGLELKADSAYVVAPPSVTTAPYVWEVPDAS